MGLGHLRRNLALAAALREGPDDPQVLVVTGAAEAGRFALPPGVDLLTLPGVAKHADGTYRSRRWSTPLEAVVDLRRAVLTAGLEAFAPDLLVVDKVAHGFAGELAPALARLRGAGTRLVLGLRDVLDGPAAAAAEWRRLRTTEALRIYYDEVWVYGDERVSDLAADCRIPPSVRHLLRYTGFLAAGRATAQPAPVSGPYVLCVLGGGEDGAELAEAFAAAAHELPAVIVGGPYLPPASRARLDAAAAAAPALHVVGFCADAAAWLPAAAAVVCMGGYNTVTEVLATDTPALVVPRCRPRTEQLIRASRLSNRGLVDDLHPDELSPTVLSRWLAGAVTRPRRYRTGIDLTGLARIPELVGKHVQEARSAAA